MTEQRDEELSRLYVLRAGISVIGREDGAFRAAAKREYDGHSRERERVQAIDAEVDAKTREQWQMETCFYRLSEEIRSSTRQIVSSINSLNTQMQQNAATANAYLNQISSAAAINNALQASANRSSAQLVGQVRALREYASMMR